MRPGSRPASAAAIQPVGFQRAWTACGHERDGFIEDANDDRTYNNRDRLFLRGQLMYEPNADTSYRLIVDHTTRDEVCCAAVGLVRGPTADIIQGVAVLQTRNPAVVGIAFDPYDRKATVSPQFQLPPGPRRNPASHWRSTPTRSWAALPALPLFGTGRPNAAWTSISA